MWHASAPLLAAPPHRRRDRPGRLRDLVPARRRRPATTRTASARWRSTRWRRWRSSASTPSPWPGTTAAGASPTGWRSTIPSASQRLAVLDIVPTGEVWGEADRRRRPRLLALGVPGAARAAAGAADRRRPRRVLRPARARTARPGASTRTAIRWRCSTPTGARSTTRRASRRCARTTGRARPSTSSTTTPTAPPAAGSPARCSCCGPPTAACPRFYPDVLDVWRPWAPDVRGDRRRRQPLPGRGRPRRRRPLRPPSHLPRDHASHPNASMPSTAGATARCSRTCRRCESDAPPCTRSGGPAAPCDLGDGVAEDTDSDVAAVWPFFGQFLAHDITADRSPLVDRADPARIRNFRAPRANLEGVYGTGPVGAPYLYAADDPAKLLLAPSGIDVPRNHEGIALIGDPRNDAHLFTSQMPVAFIGLHNRLVDRLRDDGVAEAERLRGGAARGHLALPARDPARVPARPDRRGADRRAARRRPAAVPHRRRRPVHPVRVRRRRLPLRPRADPRPLPGQRRASARCRCSPT